MFFAQSTCSESSFCMLCCIQMGTNTLASQKGMTSYGTRRYLYDSRIAMENPQDKSTISLQMGTNKGASQVKCCSWMLHHRTSDKRVNTIFHLKML